MAGPTVSRVEAATPMLALQAVVDERDAYEIVQKAKKAGARDILVVPIERIIP
jgi:ATP phosphoribosyltransferase